MKATVWLIATVLLLPGCAALGLGGGDDRSSDHWSQAHQALAVEDYPRAQALFQRLVNEQPESSLARESVFYLGAMRMDPRNPAWDPKPAEGLLREYLAFDSVGLVTGNRAEADILLQLAAQLNMPPRERLPAFQPEVVVTRPERVIVPAQESRALAAEVAQLRREVAARDSTIQAQREELERIRRTLTGRTGGN